MALDTQVADASVNFGLFKAAVIVFGLVITLLTADAILAGRQVDTSIGHWAQAWARRYPAFALAISFFVGAMIGHFFWDTWSPG